MRNKAIVVAVLLASAPWGFSQRGALVRPNSLDQLVSKADRIVHGHVIAAKVEPHPQYKNLSTVVVTMQVTDTLKGEATKHITFRQFIWDWRDKADAAGYRKGKELVLFLNKINAEGLTSPAGMDQGRIEVRHDAIGNAYIQPHATHKELLGGIEAALAKKSASTPRSIRAALIDPSRKIELADFKEAVRDLAGARRRP